MVKQLLAVRLMGSESIGRVSPDHWLSGAQNRSVQVVSKNGIYGAGMIYRDEIVTALPLVKTVSAEETVLVSYNDETLAPAWICAKNGEGHIAVLKQEYLYRAEKPTLGLLSQISGNTLFLVHPKRGVLPVEGDSICREQEVPDLDENPKKNTAGFQGSSIYSHNGFFIGMVIGCKNNHPDRLLAVPVPSIFIQD